MEGHLKIVWLKEVESRARPKVRSNEKCRIPQSQSTPGRERKSIAIASGLLTERPRRSAAIVSDVAGEPARVLNTNRPRVGNFDCSGERHAVAHNHLVPVRWPMRQPGEAAFQTAKAETLESSRKMRAKDETIAKLRKLRSHQNHFRKSIRRIRSDYKNVITKM